MRRAFLREILAARRAGRVLVRALDLENGEEKLIDPASDASPLGLLAARAAAQDVSGNVLLNGRRLFLTVYGLPWEIVIVGAVHIAQALAALAAAAGYRLRVIDPRAPYATAERFPGVTIMRQWPDAALAQQPLTPHSALIALAHDPKLDDPALAVALGSEAFYVGALGSVRTQARRLQRLRAAGLSEGELARLRGPVGLAIGAHTPVEIAIAVLAELVQVRRARPRLAGIVLAAGMSSRMGRNKLLEDVHGKPLIRYAVDAALAGGLDPVIVVTGHESGRLDAALNGAPVTLVHNSDFARGLSSSLRTGISAVPGDCSGAMVLLGDMPGIDGELVRRLGKAFEPERNIVIATSRGVRGHPVLLRRDLFQEIAGLTGDHGAKALIAKHSADVFEVEAGNDAPILDVDLPVSLHALRNQMNDDRTTGSHQMGG